MESNFKIISFTEIEFNGVELDLHNNFDFVPEKMKVSENRITLHFKKSKGDWAINTPFDNLDFILEGYSFFKHIEPKIEWLEDDFCLGGITFFDSDFREEDNGLIERQNPKENDDIIFSFESGRVIRVNCETVSLKT